MKIVWIGGLPEGPERNVVLEALGVAVALVDQEVGHGHVLLGAFLYNLYGTHYEYKGMYVACASEIER